MVKTLIEITMFQRAGCGGPRIARPALSGPEWRARPDRRAKVRIGQGTIARVRAMSTSRWLGCAARIGWISVTGSWAGFIASPWTTGLVAILALVELGTDQMPSGPGLKGPVRLGTRILSGAFCGAMPGLSASGGILGLVAGGIGAAAWTCGAAWARPRLAGALGCDLPAALIEDPDTTWGAISLFGWL